MAKLKPAKGGKSKQGEAKSFVGAVPCLVLIIGGLVLVFVLLNAMLRSQGGGR